MVYLFPWIVAIVTIGVTIEYWYISIPVIGGLIAFFIWLWRRGAPARAAKLAAEHEARIQRVERLVIETRSASRTMIERQFHVSPQVAVTMLKVLETRGVVSEPNANGRRKVIAS
jgi:DNA segregation ATPase FtsK/SpoIIIE-like protein